MRRYGALKRETREANQAARPQPAMVTLVYFALLLGGGAVILLLALAIMGIGTAGALLEGLAAHGVEGKMSLLGILDSVLDGAALGRAAAACYGALLLLTLWSGIVGSGFRRYCLSLQRGATPGVSALLWGFSRLKTVLAVSIILGGAMAACSRLLEKGISAAVFSLSSISPALGDGAGVILKLAAACAVALVGVSYSLSYYLLMDDPTCTYAKAFTGVRQLMRGHYLNLARMIGSFAGWLLVYIVAAIPVARFVSSAVMGMFTSTQYIDGAFLTTVEGDGTVVAALVVAGSLVLLAILFALWLMPYMGGCLARFYDHLRGSGTEGVASDVQG